MNIENRGRERGVRRVDGRPAAGSAGQPVDPTPDARGAVSGVNVLQLGTAPQNNSPSNPHSICGSLLDGI